MRPLSLVRALRQMSESPRSKWTLLRRKRSIATLPPLLSKIPATKVVPITEGTDKKKSNFKTPTVSLPGGQDLRERAQSLASRRHSTIQYQLAAARFNTSLQQTRRDNYLEKQEQPPDESLDTVWDEYVKAVASRRKVDGTKRKAGRGLARRLESLGMYMDACAHRRSSQAPALKPDLRQSELQKFEVLRRTVQGHKARSPRFHPDAQPSGGRARPGLGQAALQAAGLRRRSSVRVVHQPTASKDEGQAALQAAGLRRRSSVRVVPQLTTAKDDDCDGPKSKDARRQRQTASK